MDLGGRFLVTYHSNGFKNYSFATLEYVHEHLNYFKNITPIRDLNIFDRFTKQNIII